MGVRIVIFFSNMFYFSWGQNERITLEWLDVLFLFKTALQKSKNVSESGQIAFCKIKRGSKFIDQKQNSCIITVS